MSDQERISPYRVNAISSRQVMRIKKNSNQGIFSQSNTKYSKLYDLNLIDGLRVFLIQVVN